MVKPDTPLLGAEPPHGFPGGLVGLVRLLGGVGGGGTDGDGAPAAEAEVTHPAPAGFRDGDRRTAAVVVGVVSGYGGHGWGTCVCVSVIAFSGFI